MKFLSGSRCASRVLAVMAAQVLVLVLALALAGCSSNHFSGGAALPSPSLSIVSTGTSSVTSTRTTTGTSTGTSTTAATAGTSTASASTATSTGTTTTSAVTALPAAPITGMNQSDCRSVHRPVLLLHGTFSNIRTDFSVLVPALLADGFCVYGQNYGLFGTGPIKESAADVATFTKRVLAVTGAAAVDAVGFSQGGLVLRTAMRLNGLASSVRTAVLLAPSFHGTTSALIGLLPDGACPACFDQQSNSALLAELAAGGDLEPSVHYAVAVLSTDRIVTPWRSQIPVGATEESNSEQVISVVVNEQCPSTTAVHENLPRSASVVAWAVAALTSGGKPDPNDLTC